MHRIERLYTWLSSGPTPDCDRIFGAALRAAEPEWIPRIADRLLARGNDAACAALIQNFSRLPDAARQAVTADRERLKAGLTLAMRSSSHAARCSAIDVLAQTGTARLAYLLSDALRDRDLRVRDRAAAALRDLVIQIVDQPPPDTANASARTEYRNNRAELAAAMHEALRTFEVHHCTGLLEACLWMARDLNDRLWRILNRNRSRAGYVVSGNLMVWNQPRLAGFLVSAMKHPEWRLRAVQALKNWNTLAHAVALLRETALLDDPEIRAQMAAFKQVAWFSQARSDLAMLPADLRRHAPRWVSCLGVADDVKVSTLTRLVRSDDSSVQRSALYEVVRFDSPAVLRSLGHLARGTGPLARFARWYQAGLADENDMYAPPGSGGGPGASAGAIEQLSADELTTLWRACQRARSPDQQEMIAIIREHVGQWRAWLNARLASTDPHDRLLAIRIAGTAALAPLFREAVRRLTRDPIDGIARLASTIAAAAGQDAAPRSPSATPDPGGGAAAGDVARPLAEVRAELRELHAAVAARSGEPLDAQTSRRAASLLRSLHGPMHRAPEPPVGEEAR
jgi:hypothetical protein